MDKKKIDYCICHKSLESGESVEYTAIDTQTVKSIKQWTIAMGWMHGKKLMQ